MVTLRVESPTAAGHFITRLARSYGPFMPRLTRTLTCTNGDDLSLGYLEYMHVITNMGSHWSIPMDNDGEQLGQPKEQLREREQEMELGPVEREMTEMIIDIYPFYF